MRVLHLALLLGVLGGPDGFDGTLQGGATSPVVFRASFGTQGVFASPVTADTGQSITVTRASTKTCVVNGTPTTAAANALCVEANGALIEKQSTNFLLNSHSPATQTTASLSATSYTGSMTGSGSLVFTVGTATATGLPCTATSASDCHFSITGAGTITATPSGTVSTEQLEPLPYRTSDIPTGGTTVTRSADTVFATLAVAQGINNLCMGATYTPENSSAWRDSTDNKVFVGLGSFSGNGAAANCFGLWMEANGNVEGSVEDSAAAFRQYVYSGNSIPAGSTHALLYCLTSPSVTASYLDGASQTINLQGSGTGIWNASQTKVLIGSANNGTMQVGGYVKKVLVCNSAAAGSCT